jgi:hypothetical protein
LFSLKTKVDSFSRFGLETSGYGFSRFGLKISGYDSCVLATKPLAWVSRFGPQNWQQQFGDLAHKITTIVSWFGPQNQVGCGLLVAPQNQREDEDGVGHASRSSGLLHLKASLARVSLYILNTGRGVVWMGHVASSRRSRGDEAEDGRVIAMGCIRLFYPNFAISVVLGHKGSLVINFSINRSPSIGGEDQVFSHPSPAP